MPKSVSMLQSNFLMFIAILQRCESKLACCVGWMLRIKKIMMAGSTQLKSSRLKRVCAVIDAFWISGESQNLQYSLRNSK